MAASLAFAAVLLSPAAFSDEPAPEDARLVESRALVNAFAQELQQALLGAMRSGGPDAAIDVCRSSAPEIAARLSRNAGASVSRVSVRYRNPQSYPEPWQQDVLDQFSATLAKDPQTPVSQLEHFEWDGRGGARYLKAITIAPLCLTCHGEQLDRTVADQLGADYPHDRATGYRLGDLRGAFSAVWPAD